MKLASIAIAVLLSAGAVTVGAQDNRGTWKIERGSAGYKADNTPGKDAYKEGMNYYLGANGYKRDYEKALELLNTAAEAGNPLALYQLGNCYRYGNGVKINKKKAAEYWQRSSDLGCAEAKYELGYLYYKGDGVKRNYDTAFALFSESAEAGNHAALFMLGECYWDGTGVKKDKATAIEYWLKSANKGNHKARERVKAHTKEKKLLLSGKL